MKVKIIEFQDCRIILTDEPSYIPGIICRHTKFIENLPKEDYLIFNCKEDLFTKSLRNKKSLQHVIKIYHQT